MCDCIDVFFFVNVFFIICILRMFTSVCVIVFFNICTLCVFACVRVFVTIFFNICTLRKFCLCLCA